MRKIAVLAVIFSVIYVLFVSLLMVNAYGQGVENSETFFDNYPIAELPALKADSIDLYMQSVNENLSLAECHRIKRSLRNYAQNTDQFYIMLSIISIESRFKKDAVSFLGAKYGRGLAQVSEIALKEYNLWNNTNILADDLYDIDTNIKIACFTYQHFSVREELSLVENVMAYNKGLSGYRKNKNDLRYYYKFLNEYSNFCS